jgi:putative colanic acid biosynthesis acetyltransferase WcaF
MTMQPETPFPAVGGAGPGAHYRATGGRFRPSSLSRRNQAARALWGVVWILLFRPSPKILYGWRRFLLRLFGARLGRGAVVHASVRVFAPWNLEMGEYACLSHFIDCYCVDRISIGAYATVSQYSFLCSASHDHRHFEMPLITKPVEIGAHAWVAADVFVAPGVEIGEGAVVQARSTVLDDVPAWTIAAGHPARPIRERVMIGAIPVR